VFCFFANKAVYMTRISALRWKTIRGITLCVAAMLVFWVTPVRSGGQPGAEAGSTQAGAVYVCDSMASGKPQWRSIVFPAAQGTLYCYSDFARVSASEQITHVWFFRDREVAQFRLTIQPPRWSSYSSLKIPPESRGPWRVEVLDQNGQVYGVARFSIVD
jgi:hypothetical protein